MDQDTFELIFFLGFTSILLITGFVVGTILETRHLNSLSERETTLFRKIKLTNLRRIPEELNIDSSFFVTGGVVISTDYFKTFITAIKKLFGGRLSAYESLMSRSRREALVRMTERAQRKGADMVVGIRYETANISRGRGNNKGVTGVEVIAYGTALKLKS